jgi:hypothetical protein
MYYFIQRLLVFVIASLLVHIIAPHILGPNINLPVSIYQTAIYTLLFCIIFLVCFGVSETALWVFRKKWSIQTTTARDASFCLIFLIGCMVFLFAPRPENFSFGDNIGKIMDHGSLTAYGWKVQAALFKNEVMVAIIFFLTCRAYKGPMKHSKG